MKANQDSVLADVARHMFGYVPEHPCRHVANLLVRLAVLAA
jgi:hypothetical protein